jgi:hypothetical protein
MTTKQIANKVTTMKTLFQISSSLGISKQRLSRFFKKQGITPHCIQGQAMQYDEADEQIAIAHFANDDTTSKSGIHTASITQNIALIDAVIKQLEEKDKVIERLQAENFMLMQKMLEERKPFIKRIFGKLPRSADK